MSKFEINKELYDNIDEYYFECFLKELLKEGFISSYKRQPESFKLTNGLRIPYTETIQLKTKIKILNKEQIILRPSEYTADFIVIWNNKAKDIFFQSIDCGIKIVCPFIANNSGDYYYSYVECKPSFDWKNMTRLFEINQKFIWHNFKEYINLVVVPELFENVFTPKEFLHTLKTKQKRKLKFIPFSLKQYVSKNDV